MILRVEFATPTPGAGSLCAYFHASQFFNSLICFWSKKFAKSGHIKSVNYRARLRGVLGSL